MKGNTSKTIVFLGETSVTVYSTKVLPKENSSLLLCFFKRLIVSLQWPELTVLSANQK